MDPALKQRAQAARAAHQQAYAAAPTDEDARAEAIGQINMASAKDIEAMDAELARAALVLQEQLLQRWAGRWKAPNHVLNIGTDRSVHYESSEGSMQKTIDANLQSLTATEHLLNSGRFPACAARFAALPFLLTVRRATPITTVVPFLLEYLGS